MRKSKFTETRIDGILRGTEAVAAVAGLLPALSATRIGLVLVFAALTTDESAHCQNPRAGTCAPER